MSGGTSDYYERDQRHYMAEVKPEDKLQVDHEEIERQRKFDLLQMKAEHDDLMQSVMDKGLSIRGRIKHIKYLKDYEGVADTTKIAYAFIKPFDRRMDDVFMHFNALEPWKKNPSSRELSMGDVVSFKVEPGKDGKWAAKMVQVVCSYKQGEQKS